MVELAIRGHPSFQLCRVELDRPPPSYTIDTVRQLQSELRDPEIVWYFLVGSDTALELPAWREFGRLSKLVEFVAIPRPGHPAGSLPDGVREIPVKTLEISSSEIRRWIREGRSIHSVVPEAVGRYIEEHRLYR